MTRNPQDPAETPEAPIPRPPEEFHAPDDRGGNLLTILECFPHAILVLDHQLDVVFWNPRLLDLWRISLEWNSTRASCDRIERLVGKLKDPTEFRRVLDQIAAGQRPTDRLHLETNDDRTIDCQISPCGEDFSGCGGYLLTFFDLTDRLVVERALMDSRKMLRNAYEANRRSLDDLAAAHRRLLPATYPPAGGLQFAPFCRPCTDVGGDLYHIEQLDDERVALVIADVAGHGPNAAIAAAMCKALLIASLHQADAHEGPAAIIDRLARWLRPQLDDHQFITLWVGLWNPHTKRLQYASCAHPIAILHRPGRTPVHLQQENSLPLGFLGLLEYHTPTEQEIALETGDRVIVYTDGWIESVSSKGETLRDEEFLELVSNGEQQPTGQVPTTIYHEFERFLANSAIRDDLTLLVIDRIS